MFKVSVVIPVYNAEEFVVRAVESAVCLPEVGEVRLVEDGSPDNSLAICKQVAQSHKDVHLHRHPGGVNRGAGASRNLGIKKASLDYIGFLDADDWYLNHRFKRDAHVLPNRTDVDGIYHACGHYYHDTATWERWGELCTVHERVAPDNFFDSYVQGNGHPHLDGLTVRSSAIGRTGLLREDLRLHQDSEWVMRLAYHCRLLAGSIDDPVAMIGIHHKNRMPNSSFESHSKEWKAKYKYFIKKRLKTKNKIKILKNYILYHPSRKIKSNFVYRWVQLAIISLWMVIKSLPYLIRGDR